jgi:hypothetical protein
MIDYIITDLSLAFDHFTSIATIRHHEEHALAVTRCSLPILLVHILYNLCSIFTLTSRHGGTAVLSHDPPRFS